MILESKTPLQLQYKVVVFISPANLVDIIGKAYKFEYDRVVIIGLCY